MKRTKHADKHGRQRIMLYSLASHKPHDPDKHHRQSIRLRGWDYTTPGAYVITICTYPQEILFEDDRFRELAENVWQNIPTQPHARRVNR